jgi:hypothetical protein
MNKSYIYSSMSVIKKAGIFLFMGIFVLTVCMVVSSYKKKQRFTITEDKAQKRVDILVDGKPFTAYIYPDELMKPVLYPLRTTKGTLVTRGWPLDARPGERTDHPHHVGMWFNYGDVNGLDFWNNSTAIPQAKKSKYGTIKHVAVNKMSANDHQAELVVTMHWQKPDGTNLIKQISKYIFTSKGEVRGIELITRLTALKEDISFKDNKEGLLGIRVARELEHPSNQSDVFTDANGIATGIAKMNNEGVSGKYRNSEGTEGDNVWGKRSKWVNLNGKIGNELVSLVIMDSPENVGYPTYWHARGYGLFAANPLGQKEFSEGKEVLDYKLQAGKSVVFKYKVLISSGRHLSDQQVNSAFKVK